MPGVNGMGLSLDASSYGEDTAVHKWFRVTNFKTSKKKNHSKNEQVSSLGLNDSTPGIFEITGSFDMLAYPEYLPMLYSSNPRANDGCMTITADR